MEGLYKLKQDTINRYEMALALVGDEICKETDSKLSDDLELMIMKAHSYCIFYIDRIDANKELKEKCQDYLNIFRYYEKILY